ncbi:interferon alpha-2-like [Octodon degus]|uniref:Interferon alpha-2-like n=1 Tax=Octodon degus TaxID=10160 RepID=A0A6P3FFM8_OCTDE|nr:interferon alpha-2-like [Octodon degus]
MALTFTLLMAPAIFSCRSAYSLDCGQLQAHSLRPKSVLILLEQMRRISTFSCLKDRKDFGLPQQEFDGKKLQKAQALYVLHEVNIQTFSLFSTQYSSAAWDKSLLDAFRTGLHQQLEDLWACLTQEEGLEEAALLHEAPRLAVRRYFHRIAVYLNEKRYSPCAWEVVRAEIRRAFSSAVKLQERSWTIE